MGRSSFKTNRLCLPLILLQSWLQNYPALKASNVQLVTSLFFLVKPPSLTPIFNMTKKYSDKSMHVSRKISSWSTHFARFESVYVHVNKLQITFEYTTFSLKSTGLAGPQSAPTTKFVTNAQLLCPRNFLICHCTCVKRYGHNILNLQMWSITMLCN